MTPIERAHQRRVEMKAEGIEIVRLTPEQKLAAKPNSMRLAVTCKCRDCMGGPEAGGNLRAEIRACTAPSCPLYAVRPYQAK